MFHSKKAAGGEKILEALELLREAAKEKKVELSNLISEIFEEAKEAQEVAVDKIKGGAKDLNKQAHSNPWAFVGVAALSGFVLGLLYSKR